MNKLIAQQEIPLGPPISGLGPLGNPGANAPSLFNRFFTGLIGIMTAIAAIWFVILILTGAIGIITSSGDKGAMETARGRITTGLIGLVVVISAIFIIDLVGKLLGIDYILDPGAFINTFQF
jgi:hypothetical protein